MTDPEPSTPDTPPKLVLGTQPEILVLGIVSFLTDASSELIFSVLSVFLTSVLGASTLVLGLMEGLADFSSSSLDLLSGYLSDRTGKRKTFASAGYALSAVSKGILLLAATATHVVLFRVVERLGKSVRGAPRDALLGAIAPEKTRGTSFGIHKAMDRAGAVVGPLAAWLLLDRLGPSLETFRYLFTIALIPALLAVLVLVVFVRDRRVEQRSPLSLVATLRALDRSYWSYVLAASIFSIAYFSFAFLQVNAVRVGFSLAQIPLLYALFNVTFTIVSIPLGKLGDRIGRRTLILFEFALYQAMLAVLILAPNRAGVVAGFMIYGVFFAIDEGQSKAYLTDLSGKQYRATAIGAYNFITGLFYVAASVIAGALWDTVGPSATFGFAAIVTAVAGGAFLLRAPDPPRA